ncbi:hypothetical protein [Halomicroarcula sp. GCM10025743]|uniref:hypothetical protein n=1 Tax=Haloarcula TaxID=2237 RepID=UPI003608ABA3
MTDRVDGDGPPLFTPRTSRRMTRTHAVLWTVVLLATSADVVLTVGASRTGSGRATPSSPPRCRHSASAASSS